MALVLAAALTAVAAGCGGVDRSAHVQANEQLFAALPSFPGSQLRGETSTGYRSGESGPVIDYGTRFDLKLPAAATAIRVGSFFRNRLQPRWRLVETLDHAV